MLPRPGGRDKRKSHASRHWLADRQAEGVLHRAHHSVRGLGEARSSLTQAPRYGGYPPPALTGDDPFQVAVARGGAKTRACARVKPDPVGPLRPWYSN